MRKRSVFRKRRSPPPVKNIFVITMVIFALMIWGTIELIDKGITPTLKEVAENKTKEFATRGINAAVKYAEGYQFEDVVQYTKNNEGDITSWNFNPAALNEINRYATDKVEEFFKRMNSGKVPNKEDSDLKLEYGETAGEKITEDPTLIEIPIGQATGNTILANLGPKIPVNFQLSGSVKTDVINTAKSVGINTVLIKLYIHVEADVQIVIPFSTDMAHVSTDVYIGSTIANFGVPEYYGGGGNDPPIAIPKDEFEKDLKKKE